MSEFSVVTRNISKEADLWEFAAREIDRERELINNICKNLSITGSSASIIKGNLRKVSNELGEIRKSSVSMKQALVDIIDFYEKAEATLVNSKMKNHTKSSHEKDQAAPDYDYAKEVQKILDKLNGKDSSRLDQLKYLYDFFKKASLNDPQNCMLTKAEKEAFLKFIGDKMEMDQIGEAGVDQTQKMKNFFSNEWISTICNGKVINAAEQALVGKIAGSLAKYLGFVYNEKTDSYYTKEGCIQQQWGFCDAIDDWGPGLGMDLDTEIVTFVHDGQEFRVQLWKGIYAGGLSLGSEFAIYSRSVEEALANPYERGSENSRYIYYESVEDKYQPMVKQETSYRSSNKTTKSFKCDTRDYGDGDDYWNLNIRSDAGVIKETIEASYNIDCSNQGEEFAQEMAEAFKGDSNLSAEVEVEVEGTTVILKY